MILFFSLKKIQLEQLMEIKKSSLASLICDNTDTIGRIQPIAFLRPESW